MSIKVSELKDKKVKSLTTRILDFLGRHKETAYKRSEIARYLKVNPKAVSNRLGWLVGNKKINYIRPYYYYVEEKTNKKTTIRTNKKIKVKHS